MLWNTKAETIFYFHIKLLWIEVYTIKEDACGRDPSTGFVTSERQIIRVTRYQN